MIKKAFIYISGALIVGLILATFGGAAIKGVYGFAVAGVANKWHNVKDFSSGDDLTTGSMSVIPCVYDGTNCDRIRGDITNGLDVDVTRVNGTVATTSTGASTPGDNAANPTTAIITDSRLSAFDGVTWDRLLNTTLGNALVPVSGLTTANFLYGYDADDPSWNRLTTNFTLSTFFLEPNRGLDTISLIYGYDEVAGNWQRVAATRINSTAIGLNVSAISDNATFLLAVTTPQVSSSDVFNTTLCKHTWTVLITGAPTAVVARVEGSLDDTNWFTLDTTSSIVNTMRHIVDKCVAGLRVNLVTLTGGTAPTITIQATSK